MNALSHRERPGVWGCPPAHWVRAGRLSWFALTATLLIANACTTPGGATSGNPERRTDTQRALTMAFRHDPSDLSPKIPQERGGGSIKPLFNAGLTVKDSEGVVRPRLAQSLPVLNTDAWRVAADGRMETIYQLRPGLTWHDGQPLTAQDFVFAWRTYSHPELGVFGPKPQDQIEEAIASDPQTLVLRWKSPFADADILAENFPPLPRHILEAPRSVLSGDPGSRDTFLAHPYWTQQYVGAGPFRLDRWEPGVELQGSAFEGYVEGRPKIDRVIARIVLDENVALTHMLSENTTYAHNYTLRFEHIKTLKDAWGGRARGTIHSTSEASVFGTFQFRPEFQQTPPLLDVRVRRSMAHTMDKQMLQDGLFEGEGTPSHTFVSREEAFYPQVDRVIAKYPFDPRRAEQLMSEAGFTRDGGSMFASAGGQRFRPEFRILEGTVAERAQAILVDVWSKAGLDVQPAVMPAAQVRDPEARNTFPGMSMSVGGGVAGWISSAMGTPANRWAGSNRGGWSFPDYDRLYEVYNGTLERSQRDQRVIEMARLVSDQLPGLILYDNFVYQVHFARLSGPRAGPLWNLHEWEIV